MLDPMPALPQDPPEGIPLHVIDQIEHDLEPCPFCLRHPFIESGVYGFSVGCDCGVSGPVNEDIYESAGKWNHRPRERRATKRPFNIGGQMGVM